MGNETPRPFVVFALPRSRTAWLAHLLGKPPRTCGHDIAIGCGSIEDFLSAFEPAGPLAGTVETGTMMGHKLIRQAFPLARFATVRRSVSDVEASLAKCGITGVREELEIRNGLLDSIEKDPRVLSVRFEDLRDFSTCSTLYTHCVGEALDIGWHAGVAFYNIQVNMPERLALLARNHGAIERLKAEVIAASSQLGNGAPCPGLH